MNFELSERAQDFRERLLAFMDEHVPPAEPVWQEQMRGADDERADGESGRRDGELAGVGVTKRERDPRRERSDNLDYGGRRAHRVGDPAGRRADKRERCDADACGEGEIEDAGDRHDDEW